MTFLYPQFLYGLLALAVPVIVHLFNFRRSKKVYFSSNKFLQKVQKVHSSKRKLKHYLILASRLLFIFFLVMVFAQPFIPASKETFNKRVVIYLDNSLSMTNESDESVMALDKGVQLVNQVLESYPDNTEYKIITNDFSSFSSIYRSKAELMDFVTELKPSGISRTADEIYRKVIQDFSPSSAFDIYWLSDFQKSTYLNELRVEERDTLNRFHVIPLYFTSKSNIYIDSLFLESPLMPGQNQVNINVRLKNGGEQKAEDLLVKVFVDEVQNATSSVSVPAKGTAEVMFNIPLFTDKVIQGRISIDEYPVTFDNEFYFVLDPGRKINVLELRNANSPNNIALVYANEEIFSYRSMDISNIDYNEIDKTDLLILNQVDNIGSSAINKIKQFSRDHNSVVIIPGYLSDDSETSALLDGLMLKKVDTTAFYRLAVPDFSNPFFEKVFQEPTPQVNMPEAKVMFDQLKLGIGLLKYKNGDHFLSRINPSIYLFSVPFSERFTNFQHHALFVPVMYQIAVNSLNNSSPLYYSLNDKSIVYNMDTLMQESILKLSTPSYEFIPSQRFMGNAISIDLPKNEMSQGVFSALINGKEIGKMAFNIENIESEFEQLNKDEISTYFNKLNAVVWEAVEAEDLGAEIQESYQGVPLWKYALVLCLIFLLIEILLIRFLP